MTQRDLERDFREQWRFLHVSMKGYDDGDDIESKRLAVCIRTLVHDTRTSTSLLTHLGVKEKLWFIASGGGVDMDPNIVSGTTSLTSMLFAASAGGGSAFRYQPHSEKEMVEAHERDETDWIRPALFDDWWTCPVIKSADGLIFSRKDLVLMLANKDGGAHIDELDAKQQELRNGLNLGWGLFMGNDDENVQFENIPVSPVNASVRTIANELDLSFFNQTEVLGFEYDREPYIQGDPDYDDMFARWGFKD